MWTPEITRARYVEAAHTERFLPAALAPSSKGYWPEFFHDDEDKKGWDDAARLDNAEKWKGRASSGAISRHQECMVWTAERIDDQKRRQIVWAWAFCRANGWDFGARCVKKGWARPTAYRRLTAAIAEITDGLNNDGVLLALPADRWLRQETPLSVRSHGGIENCVSGPAIKFTPGYRTEKSRDLIRTQADADTFAKFLERRNADMRSAQEREAKRRQKLGMDAA
ncbi:MAG: polymerase subunit sigma [Bradyrhizobium sp.]|nr:polymerase subunit sigma [Bradyrhizobium sp.]